MTLEEKYPFIASWVREGEIRIGSSGEFDEEPYAAVFMSDDTVWYTDETFSSLDEILDKMERAIGVWCREQGIELVGRRGRGIPFPKP